MLPAKATQISNPLSASLCRQHKVIRSVEREILIWMIICGEETFQGRSTRLSQVFFFSLF